MQKVHLRCVRKLSEGTRIRHGGEGGAVNERRSEAKACFQIRMKETRNDVKHGKLTKRCDAYASGERGTNLRPPYPVSGPISSPLQSAQPHSASIKVIGSPQNGQSGEGADLTGAGRIGSFNIQILFIHPKRKGSTHFEDP